MMNISRVIRYHAERTPEKTALVFEGARISYAELDDRVLRLAAFLHARGIGENDVVAVMMKNAPAFIEICAATGHLGGIFLPINYRLAADEVAYIIDNSGARLLFADEEFSETVAGIPDTVLVGAEARRDIRTLCTGDPDLEAVRRPAYRRPDDLFRLMYTSGTTDRPKGSMHTYSNFYWKNIDHVIALGLSASDRILVVGPLYHVGAFDLPGVGVLWMGGSMCILREFDDDAALTAIEREKLTCAWFAPVMLGRLIANENLERFDRSSLRWAIGGGEKTPESRIHAFTDLFPNGRYIDGYGLTETCSACTLMEAGREIDKIGSTGRALTHCEVSICDAAGTELPAGEEGEICVRGPKVSAGYWKDPEKTERSFFPGGWFRTGDMGRLDEEGFLYVTDRIKDMILSGGENIASSEVERVIYALPQVADAAVIGVPDERWGERPVAVVVPKPGETLTYEQLKAHCAANLARFKVPKELHLRDALPRNPSGKVLKRALRDDFAAHTEQREETS